MVFYINNVVGCYNYDPSQIGGISMKEVIRYQCDYCEKIYKHKSSARRHEKKCFANPTTRACRTCEHLKVEFETVYVPPKGNESYGDADYDIDYFVCDIKEIAINYPGKRPKWTYGCPYYNQGESKF